MTHVKRFRGSMSRLHSGTLRQPSGVLLLCITKCPLGNSLHVRLRPILAINKVVLNIVLDDFQVKSKLVIIIWMHADLISWNLLALPTWRYPTPSSSTLKSANSPALLTQIYPTPSSSTLKSANSPALLTQIYPTPSSPTLKSVNLPYLRFSIYVFFLVHIKRQVLIKRSIQSSGPFKALYTLPPWQTVHSDTISASLRSIQSYATINARMLFVHISTTVYSQVLIYTAEWTGAK